MAFLHGPGGDFMAMHLSPATFQRENAWQAPGWSVYLMLLAVLILLTGLWQLRPRAQPALHGLAWRALLGVLLIVAALLCELQWGVMLRIVAGAVLLPALVVAGLLPRLGAAAVGNRHLHPRPHVRMACPHTRILAVVGGACPRSSRWSPGESSVRCRR